MCRLSGLAHVLRATLRAMLVPPAAAGGQVGSGAGSAVVATSAILAVLLASVCAFVVSAGMALAGQRTLCVHDVPDGQVLRVRAGPGFAAPVIGEFQAAACGVRLVGRCDGEWCEMELGASRGWVHTRHIGIYELPAGAAGSSVAASGAAASADRLAQAPLRSTAPRRERQIEQGSREPAPGSCVARVAKWDTLRIRSGPSPRNDEIGEIPAGACRVERIGSCRGDWCEVAWRGRSGWVNTYYLD